MTQEIASYWCEHGVRVVAGGIGPPLTPVPGQRRARGVRATASLPARLRAAG